MRASVRASLLRGITRNVVMLKLVADLARPELRATAFGIVNAVTGLAILPASIVAGLLWDGVGQAAPFWFGAACAAGGLVLLAFVRPARPDGTAGTGARTVAPRTLTP